MSTDQREHGSGCPSKPKQAHPLLSATVSPDSRTMVVKVLVRGPLIFKKAMIVAHIQWSSTAEELIPSNVTQFEWAGIRAECDIGDRKAAPSSLQLQGLMRKVFTDHAEYDLLFHDDDALIA